MVLLVEVERIRFDSMKQSSLFSYFKRLNYHWVVHVRTP